MKDEQLLCRIDELERKVAILEKIAAVNEDALRMLFDVVRENNL